MVCAQNLLTGRQGADPGISSLAAAGIADAAGLLLPRRNGSGRLAVCDPIILIPHTALAGGPVTSDQSAQLQGATDGDVQPVVPDQQAGRLAASQRLRHERAARTARWRDAVSIAVELAGIGVLSAGFWLIRPWAGLIVLGAGLIVLGIASSPRFDRREGPR